jgi:hypothetical protein
MDGGFHSDGCEDLYLLGFAWCLLQHIALTGLILELEDGGDIFHGTSDKFYLNTRRHNPEYRPLQVTWS